MLGDAQRTKHFPPSPAHAAPTRKGPVLLAQRPDAFRAQLVTYHAGESFKRHTHEHTSLFVVLRGRVDDRSGPHSIDAAEGSIGIIPAGVEHQTRFVGTHARTVAISFHKEWLRHALHDNTPSLNSPAYATNTQAWKGALALIGEARRPDVSTRIALDESILALFDRLTPSPVARRSKNPRNQRPAWIHDATDLLRDAPDHALTLHDVSRALGRHPAHVCRAFRDAMGCTMSEYVRLARIERAAQLLRARSHTLSQVALRAGFYDQSHFTRTFRRVIGCTPAVFARNS
jgi:AraC family transcriptional regulator